MAEQTPNQRGRVPNTLSPSSKRLIDAIAREIREDHPNALSRLDVLDGVGRADQLASVLAWAQPAPQKRRAAVWWRVFVLVAGLLVALLPVVLLWEHLNEWGYVSVLLGSVTGTVGGGLVTCCWDLWP